MANMKHFALYDGQPNQYSIIDDQVAHEIYLRPFETAIAQAQPASVMCSYSQIQITPVQSAPAWACHNDYLLNVILHGQWGFQGLVLSDYTATHAADLQNGTPTSSRLLTSWFRSEKQSALQRVRNPSRLVARLCGRRRGPRRLQSGRRPGPHRGLLRPGSGPSRPRCLVYRCPFLDQRRPRHYRCLPQRQ
jgi:hypothetical protein